MSGWMPWTDEKPDYVRMEMAGYILQLERLNIGEGKTIERREQTSKDLVLSQRGRPRMRQFDLRFGSYHLYGDVPREWTFQRFAALMTAFPGWPVTLVWPDDTIQHGIILDYSLDEVGDCAGDLAFTFAILREYPQGKVMAE